MRKVDIHATNSITIEKKEADPHQGHFSIN